MLTLYMTAWARSPAAMRLLAVSKESPVRVVEEELQANLAKGVGLMMDSPTLYRHTSFLEAEMVTM